MLESTLIPLLAQYWPLVLLAATAVHLARNHFNKSLHRFPSPTFASLSNLHRFVCAVQRNAQNDHIAWHRKLGPVVRIGPNVLSFSSPQAVKDIYGLNKGFTKTEFYPVQSNLALGKLLPSLFSTQDEHYHATLRRNVNAAFAMSTLVAYEPLVDSTTSVFLKQTSQIFSSTGATCDFARWLQFYAFDVIGTVSVSKRFGFLEENRDIDGIVASIAWMLAYSAQVGQLPWVDRWLGLKSPVRVALMRLGWIRSSSAVSSFSAKCMQERAEQTARIKSGKDTSAGDDKRGVDFLTRFALAQKANPEFMTDDKVLTMLNSLVNAGSDTTAISLSSVFYHLLQHPRVYETLMIELGAAAERGDLPPVSDTDAIVSYAAASRLPYLDAVIQEAFRLFPAAGLLLERYTPPTGATIDGVQVPPHTIVGCNAWVVHRSEQVFGPDVDSFRPERWLEADESKRKEMKAAMLQFGAGARTCIGKNISLLEIYKLVPTFLRAFDIQWAPGCRDWRTENDWFVRQHNFHVVLTDKR